MAEVPIMPEQQMPPVLRFMLAARRCELQGLESLAVTGELVVLIGRLVHALQKERGCSNLYLGNPEPRILRVLDGHSDEARETEQQVRQCFERMDLESASAADRARLFNRIAFVLHGLDELPRLRRLIREAALPSVEATATLTRLIGGLLGGVFEAADTALDPSITRILVAMFNFMQGKELAGQERAGGVAGFSQGYCDARQREHLQHLKDGQQRCFETFRQFAESQALALWQQLLTHESQTALEQLRGMLQRTSDQARVEAALGEVWFDLATQRIDLMRGIEEQLAEDLRSRCRLSIEQAKADLDNHRVLLGRLAGLGANSEQAVLFNIQGSSLDAPPRDGVGSHLSRSLLDLMKEQTQRLNQVNDDLKEARQSLDERKCVERAKLLLMREYGLGEADAYRRLQQAAMERGMRLVDVAQGLFEQLSRRGA